ncbi:hypothetical protein P8C59_000311 [Phyllachora maydis]|uniref:Uncharacterized protein n=1 Tax=Phyllachora maydis TaxID=1825666 RepID=A0AAD9HVP1_9PEZI|nr:hypothetical protein P8C59_000311 [Phyllachora maydis]
MADLLAAAVYASVRSCGGPIIPLRTGRIDATAAGPVGVPQPENSRRTFINQFDRMGFSIPDMIQMVACGHTIGRVHSTTFPHLVPSSTPDGEQAFDSTDAVFDNKIVTDYVSGNTTDPLVVGPSIAVGQNADLKVFNADRNATITAMTDARAFATSCQAILQRMIEVVPSSVSLSSSTLVSYMVKPVGMQLTLNKDASTLALSGWIRVKTTKLPMDQISSLTLDWLDRNGGKDCGKIGHCSVTATVQGAATGLDDSFAFFPINQDIDTSAGISAFTVTLNLASGQQRTFDNNGNMYPLTDAILLQKPQSSPLTTTTASIPTASSVSPDLGGKQLVGGYTFVGCWTEGTGVRALRDASFSYDTMTLESCAAHCTGRAYFGAEYGRECYCGDALDASSGPAPGGPPDCSFPCAGNAAERCGAGNRLQLYSTTASQAASTPTPTPTPTAKKTVGAYTFVGCATEGSDGRALSQLSYESDTMTLESCASFCSRFRHFGTEYSRECYCAGSLADSSKNASLSDCSMSCAGNGLEYCGGPNRLQLYTRNVSAPQLPSAIKKVLSSTGLEWTYQNCMTEGYDVRALSAAFNAADNMTLEGCAGFCGGYTYFGTEYGRECYCGNSFNNGSVQAAQTDCSMFCSGNPAQFCGAGNRLSVFTR